MSKSHSVWTIYNSSKLNVTLVGVGVLPPQSPQNRPMNDIKTIEELKAHHERLKGVV